VNSFIYLRDIKENVHVFFTVGLFVKHTSPITNNERLAGLMTKYINRQNETWRQSLKYNKISISSKTEIDKSSVVAEMATGNVAQIEQ